MRRSILAVGIVAALAFIVTGGVLASGRPSPAPAAAVAPATAARGADGAACSSGDECQSGTCEGGSCCTAHGDACDSSSHCCGHQSCTSGTCP